MLHKIFSADVVYVVALSVTLEERPATEFEGIFNV